MIKGSIYLENQWNKALKKACEIDDCENVKERKIELPEYKKAPKLEKTAGVWNLLKTLAP